MRRERLRHGGLRLTADGADFVVARIRPGLALVSARGRDRGQLEGAVVDELSAELTRFPMPLSLFVDAREVEIVGLSARAVWTDWLARHRDQVEHLDMLVSSPPMQLVAEVAAHYARTQLTVHVEPAMFAEALGRASGPSPGPFEDAHAEAVALRVERSGDTMRVVDDTCEHTVRAIRPGVIEVKIAGVDRGAGASPVFDALAQHLTASSRASLFLDLESARMPSPFVASTWMGWLGANRERLGSVTLLATDRSISVLAGIAGWRSRLDALVEVIGDRAAYERVRG